MVGLSLLLGLLALAVTPSHQWSVRMVPNASKRIAERYTRFETSCVVTSTVGERTPDIELYHNGTLLDDRIRHGYVESTVRESSNERIQTLNYTVDRADLRDAGAYRCKGNYVPYDVNVKLFSFTEQHVPEYQVDAGKELSLSNCAFEVVSAGYEGPDKVMWMFNDAMLPQHNRKYNVMKNGTLLITDIGPAEKGVYQCYIHFYYDDGQNTQAFYSNAALVTVLSDTSGSQTLVSLDKWLLSVVLVFSLIVVS